ncbi:MAG: hypothetical protein ACJ8AX_03230 [Gemmatimonadales bacterium]|jgi:hypothetical protein
MRTAPTLGLIALTAWALVGPARAQSTREDSMATTTIRNGNSVSSVTQSGDPATVTRHVEKRPGYTRIEQHSGGNHSVVVQSTNPADMPKMPDLKMPDLGKLQQDIDRLLRQHGLDGD